MILPFVAMLAAIACAPIVLRHHWERHYHEVSLVLGAIPVAYYLLVLHDPVRLLHQLHEYVSFIALIGSLYIVAGGIQIELRGRATPLANSLFLLIGALLANLIGTTGAAILLIRPWIQLNRSRFSPFHLIFFIFIVANAGGCLTPIANPPLFLGFIKGVPFWWVIQHCLPAWLIINTALLAIFAIADSISLRRNPASPTEPRGITIRGLLNLPCFAAIIASLLLPPWIREAVMASAAILSCLITSRAIRAANAFTFTPLKEVAWLFAGIFATMLPPLDYLTLHAHRIGIHTPLQFYWFSGALSAILDNAPTYLAFAATAFGLQNLDLDHAPDVAAFLTHSPAYVLAISLGSVFFGAMTYLGNGPNLMIKSIAESAKVPTPNFPTYIYRYAIPILLPLLILIGWLYFN
jgi:Na+/H+ antiporter NhaD/arsenite permease-like protein